MPFTVGASSISCGVYQIYGLNYFRNDEKRHLEAFITQYPGLRNSAVIYAFSDADKYGNGTYLAKYIQEHNLGAIVGTDPARNPNSLNQIRAWYWTPDIEAIRRHIKGEDVLKPVEAQVPVEVINVQPPKRTVRRRVAPKRES